MSRAVLFVTLAFAPLALAVACGSRTPLGGPGVEAGADAAKDAAPDHREDGAADAQPDAPDATPIDSGPDAPKVSLGCADGQREALLDEQLFPAIAGCAGGFTVPGVFAKAACGLGGGDDGANPSGQGCAVADLCMTGWHLCRGAADVAARIGVFACTPDAPPGTFFVTAQSGPGCLYCSTGMDPSCNQESCRASCLQTPNTTNDVFGCGAVGSQTTASCAPLTRSGNDLCSALPSPWACPGSSEHESETVTKPGPGAGGALCCKDP